MNHLRHRKRCTGFTLVELLIVISIIGILIAILLPALTGAMDAANRLACSANLSSIGKAIASYCTKYNGHYPTVYQYLAPPTTGQGSNIPNVTQTQKWTDYLEGYQNNMNDNLRDWGGAGSSSPPIAMGATAGTMVSPGFSCNLSCLFLLVRTGDAANEAIFLCKSDPYQEPDTTQGPQNYWSFSHITNCSYSYQNQVYDGQTQGLNGGSRNTSQNTIDPNMVVAADMNPFRYYDASHIPNEIPNSLQQYPGEWNSPNHKYKGQNCLYGDGHVAFNDNTFCGYQNSNIWTRGTYTAPTAAGNNGIWSNGDPNSGITGCPQQSFFTAPYGDGAAASGALCGTGDKYNSWLVP